MDSLHLTEIARKTSQVYNQLNELDPKSDNLFLIQGQITTGKTSLLRNLAVKLNSDTVPNRKPILLSPPIGQEDTAQKAMLDIAIQAKDYFPQSSLYDDVCDVSRSWKEKVQTVSSFLNEHSGKIVLLLDEPRSWSSSFEDDFFVERVRDFADLLTNVKVPRVVTGDLSFAQRRYCSEVRLEETTSPDSWLSNSAEWGGLSEVAQEIGTQLGSSLKSATGLHIRMLVGLAALEGANFIISNFQNYRTRISVISALVDSLSNRNKTKLLEALFKSALIRGLIRSDMFDFLFQGVEESDREIAKHCLMYDVDSDFEMHESIKKEIVVKLSSRFADKKGKFHRSIAQEYYQKKLASSLDDDRLIVQFSAEAYHHYAKSDTPTIPQDVRVFFTDQLNLIGKALSFMKKYDRAVEVYKTSLEWNAEDDYALHYLAYNLDFQAKDVEKVEFSYKKAIELKPNAVRWHSHWINFLLSTGRKRDAEVAWEKALDAIREGGQAGSAVYSILHEEVAVTATYMGHMDFVDQILGQIPEPNLSPSLKHMRAMAKRILDEDPLVDVLPLEHVLDPRVGKVPFRLEQGLENHYSLKKFGLGKVRAVTPKSVDLYVVFFERSGPTPYSMSFSKDDFINKFIDTSISKSKIKPGQHFEIGEYLSNRVKGKNQNEKVKSSKKTSGKILNEKIVIHLIDNVLTFGEIVKSPKLPFNRYILKHS